jgi:hypothetical protein
MVLINHIGKSWYDCMIPSTHLCFTHIIFAPNVQHKTFGKLNDETLPNINKSKHPKRGNTNNKMERPTSKKTNKPPKKANHIRNIKFLNHLLSQKAYQIKKGEDLLKGHLSYKNLHLSQ